MTPSELIARIHAVLSESDAGIEVAGIYFPSDATPRETFHLYNGAACFTYQNLRHQILTADGRIMFTVRATRAGTV